MTGPSYTAYDNDYDNTLVTPNCGTIHCLTGRNGSTPDTFDDGRDDASSDLTTNWDTGLAPYPYYELIWMGNTDRIQQAGYWYNGDGYTDVYSYNGAGVVLSSISTNGSCVLVNSANPADKILTINGTNLDETNLTLQFRKVGTGDESNHFQAEATFNSTTITFEEALSEYLLDIYSADKVQVQVRITDGENDWAILSGWSSPFYVASDAGHC
jgi:hypothetical protein